MDEYSKEIADLTAQIDRLVEEEGDKTEIADLSMQLEILKAIYARARELFAAGEGDADLRAALAMRGYGPWNFDNVYAFVYEQAVELDSDGHHQFVGEIKEADFAGMLAATG